MWSCFLSSARVQGGSLFESSPPGSLAYRTVRAPLGLRRLPAAGAAVVFLAALRLGRKVSLMEPDDVVPED